MSILISVAHSSKSKGAVDAQGVLSEYEVSVRASLACWRSLSGEFAVELFDVGQRSSSEYDDDKILRVNQCRPSLALEIHCNSGPPKANYQEVIYASEKSPAKEVAITIAKEMTDGLIKTHKKSWPSKGARVDDRNLFFLQKTNVPALIVEGLFISNEEQAAWLGSGGAEHYGVLVANGIKRWLKGHSMQ